MDQRRDFRAHVGSPGPQADGHGAPVPVGGGKPAADSVTGLQAVRVIDIAEHDPELVSAETKPYVRAFAHRIPDDLAQAGQHVVPGLMTAGCR